MGRLGIIKVHLNAFGKILGYQINWNKSEKILFNYTKEEECEFVRQRSLEIRLKSSIKYLGINIMKDLKEMEGKNLVAFRKEVEKNR